MTDVSSPGELFIRPSTASPTSPPIGLWRRSSSLVQRMFLGTWMFSPLDKPLEELDRDIATGITRYAGNAYSDPKLAKYTIRALSVSMHDPRWMNQERPTFTAFAIVESHVQLGVASHSWFSCERGVVEHRKSGAESEPLWTCSSVAIESFSLDAAASKAFRKAIDREVDDKSRLYEFDGQDLEVMTMEGLKTFERKGQSLPRFCRNVMRNHEYRVVKSQKTEVKRLEAKGLDLTDEQLALVLQRKRQEMR